MKKLNLFMLLALGLLFLSQPCFSRQPIYVMGGIQESWIRGGASLWDTPLLGFQAGVGMGIANLNEQISFRGELNISLQGSHWSEPGESGHTDLTYLNLPLVLRYQWSSGFFGELGLQPGYLLSAKDHGPAGSQDAKHWLNDFDLGIPVGIGKEFKNNLGVGLRYILGISNMMKGTGSESKGHNAVLALRVTYTFNKK